MKKVQLLVFILIVGLMAVGGKAYGQIKSKQDYSKNSTMTQGKINRIKSEVMNKSMEIYQEKENVFVVQSTFVVDKGNLYETIRQEFVKYIESQQNSDKVLLKILIESIERMNNRTK